jgi:hypothetical protein
MSAAATTVDADPLCRARRLTSDEANVLSRDSRAVPAATQVLLVAKRLPEFRARMWPYGLENAWAILRAAYCARRRPRIEAIEMRVTCPTCDAGPGEPCVFGRQATTAARVHFPRSDRAEVLGTRERAAELAALRELLPDPDWSAR